MRTATIRSGVGHLERLELRRVYVDSREREPVHRGKPGAGVDAPCVGAPLDVLARIVTREHAIDAFDFVPGGARPLLLVVDPEQDHVDCGHVPLRERTERFAPAVAPRAAVDDSDPTGRGLHGDGERERHQRVVPAIHFLSGDVPHPLLVGFRRRQHVPGLHQLHHLRFVVSHHDR